MKQPQKLIEKSTEIGGKKLTLQTGNLASQATAAVLGRLGDTMVLVTVTAGSKTDLGYFPLSVEFVERLYAGGKIKGSRWVKREGRPSDEAVLSGRLIDRSIRPLFPKDFKNDVQVVSTVLSVDGENEPDILAMITVSAALAMSNIPWNGPISAVRMGLTKTSDEKVEYKINPGGAELELSELDLIVSQTEDKTLMLEAGAKQVSEAHMLEAIKLAQVENKKMISFIKEFAKEAGSEKIKVEPDTMLLEMKAVVEKSYSSDIDKLIEARINKDSSKELQDELITRIFEEENMRNPEGKYDKKSIAKAVEAIFFKKIRQNVLKKGIRPDGRKVDEIRPISATVGLLPRTHGSAIFQRGNTQVLTVVTLGSPRLELLIESADGEEAKRYIHHYSMPPYSVGETGRMGTPSRREIGHGALAERALVGVIPSQENFPYTIRVVSEVLSSNGSTSMASTCGSTLALMDAGVPIISPVSGISVGMMSDGDDYVLLTDILGLEDFSGDMDFKVTGTDKGITAIQLDVKIPGLTIKQVEETLKKAYTGRMFVLEKMLAILPKSRTGVSEYAPKIELVKIPVEKIGELIGPGGKTIKNIIAQTGATVDVEDDGNVAISGTDEANVKKAVDWVKSLTREVVMGESFEGEVKRILPFGAFVEILPGKEGMVHVSQMSNDFVKSPSDVVKIGEKVKVRVIEIDEQGRINLSMKSGDAQSSGEQRPQREQRTENREFRSNDHPLSRQLRREKMESQKLQPRGRKTHY